MLLMEVPSIMMFPSGLNKIVVFKSFINLILLQILQYPEQKMLNQLQRNSENRERKKQSNKYNTKFHDLTKAQQKEKVFILNAQKFFQNASYDPSQLHLKEPSVARRSYLEALSTIKNRNNVEIKRIRSNNPYLSATQKLFRTVVKIVNRTQLSDLFLYNSLKNRKMSDNEQRFRKRNIQAIKQSQNIEEPYVYNCRKPEECQCGWPRPTHCPLGARIRAYI